MPNYTTSRVYKIWSPSHPGEIYIGSTTQDLAKRIGEHRRKYKLHLKGKYCYTTSFKIMEYGDAKIELIEKVECKDKEELVAREGFYIRTLDCVNKVIPDRTKKEYYEDNKEKHRQRMKNYYETNKEKIAQQKKEYRQANREKIAQRMKNYYDTNKEKIAQQKKEYRQANREKIAQLKKYNERRKARKAEKVKCDCGSVISRSSLSDHRRTKKHMKYLESIKS